MRNPFRYFNSSPEVIRLTMLMYVRHPLSLRQVEELLAERGIDICHETVRFWWNRFGPMFAAEIKKKRIAAVKGMIQWLRSREQKALVGHASARAQSSDHFSANLPPHWGAGVWRVIAARGSVRHVHRDQARQSRWSAAHCGRRGHCPRGPARPM